MHGGFELRKQRRGGISHKAVLQLHFLVLGYAAAENAGAVVALHVEQLHRRAEVARHAQIHNSPGVRS
jgi:hypothetical protein